MASLLQLAKRLLAKRPLQPLQFPMSGFDVISSNYVLEEEHYEEYKSGCYYPVNIGDVFASKYQVVGKLGFGTTSTVWLARDLHSHSFAALKIYNREGVESDEFGIYRALGEGKRSHPGYPYVRTALEMFTIPRAGGDHKCLVQKPMWDSFRDLLQRNPTHRFPESLLKAGLAQIFLALDYVHSECKLVHTDIKTDNLLLEIADKSILKAFEKAEMEKPSPRKMVDRDTTVFASRKFDRPKIMGRAVLGDFGSAVRGDSKRTHDAQPNIYRCPEVMLKMEWSYPADIWKVGAMVWDTFEDKHMFFGNDPDGREYTTRAHLAEVIGALGHPPRDLLQRGLRSHEFFDEMGNWKADVPIPNNRTLEDLEENLEGEQKKEFLRFMRCMMQWRPEDRKTAKQLLEDPWLEGYLP